MRELLARAMQQHRDVTGRQPERACGLVAGYFFEHAQRHDTAMQLGKSGHAAGELCVCLGRGERVVGPRLGARELDVDVWLRAMVATPSVACRVLDDRDEHARGIVGPIA